jgi:hypothetical protein
VLPFRRVVAVRLAAAVIAAALVETPLAASAADLCGHWRGHWQSCTDQFKGTVNARITKCGPNKYRAVFTGRAFKVMPYRYEAILTACQDPETGRVHFKCQRKIPLWGMYWMNGWASDCKFFSRYRTDDHTGYFEMRRVE